MRKRGFFGVAFYNPKFDVNIGTLVRTANIMGGSFIAVIGNRYLRQPSDTMKSHRHVPIFEYKTFEDFKKNLPIGCDLVGVELNDTAVDLSRFKHPDKACYLLGSESIGLPEEILKQCKSIVKLQGDSSMNVAVAGSIVLYHRMAL